MNTNETAPEKTKGKKAANFLNRVWDVFKGLVIAVAFVVLIFDTVFLYYLFIVVETERPSLPSPYYMETQDYLDLMEMYEKAPDSPEYRAMLKEFNTKYSIPYKNSQAYIDLVRAYRKDPDSEEYAEALEKFLEIYDIPEEKISFDYDIPPEKISYDN